jgi:membrane protein YqaA with SNARE-associated domain
MFMHSVGLSLVKFWGAQSYWEKAVRWVAEYGFAIVFAVSLGPGPTKIVAMAAGAAGLSFPLFAFIHASCRLARYGTIGWFSHIFGDRIRVWLASNHPRRVYATVTLAVLSIVLAFLLTRLLVWG